MGVIINTKPQSNKHVLLASVAGNGVKTYKQVLNEIAGQITIGDLTQDSFIVLENTNYNRIDSFEISDRSASKSEFTFVNVAQSGFECITLVLHATDSHRYLLSGTTVTDQTNVAVTAGITIYLYAC